MGFVLTGAGENNQFTAKPEVQPVFPWKEDGEDGRQLTPLGGSVLHGKEMKQSGKAGP